MSPEPVRAAERRGKARIEIPYPVLVFGADTHGAMFHINAHLTNLGSGGLYVRLPRRIEPGAQLCALVRLATGPEDKATPAPRVVTRGVVLRCDSLADGGCGVALAFKYHRFI
jgi:hypothetical protein